MSKSIFLYPLILFLIPSLGMTAGLSAAPVIMLFFGVILLNNYRNIDKNIFLNNKLELALLGWLFLTCIWSLEGISAFYKYFLLLTYYALAVICINKPWLNNIDKNKYIVLPLTFGCITAIVIFFIEYSTQGLFSKNFRMLFQANDRHIFNLYFLDRGCSILSVVSWLVILGLVNKKRWVLALVYYMLVLYVLRISDSLASYIAFILGGIAFLAMLLSKMRLMYLLMTCVLSTGIIWPLFSYYQNPKELYTNNQWIPDSGKHRLHIWKYTTGKAMEKPFTGWGFDSSKHFPIDEENDYIYYNQFKWSPLPLHPHNNFVQMWFECGIIGLTMFTLFLVKLLDNIFKISKSKFGNNWGALASACYVNYLFIAMISFGMWQLWWVATGCLAAVLFKHFGQILNKNVI